MPSETQPEPTAETEDLLRSDFPALACHAAVELDNLLRGRGTEVQAVALLASALSGTQPALQGGAPTAFRLLFDPSSDPTDAVTVNWAIRDSQITEAAPRTLNELVGELKRIELSLKSISEQPQAMAARNAAELERMRTFCLALSRRSASERESSEDWEPSHPYRR